jgi:hypothetical protein
MRRKYLLNAGILAAFTSLAILLISISGLPRPGVTQAVTKLTRTAVT